MAFKFDLSIITATSTLYRGDLNRHDTISKLIRGNTTVS